MLVSDAALTISQHPSFAWPFHFFSKPRLCRVISNFSISSVSVVPWISAMRVPNRPQNSRLVNLHFMALVDLSIVLPVLLYCSDRARPLRSYPQRSRIRKPAPPLPPTTLQCSSDGRSDSRPDPLCGLASRPSPVCAYHARPNRNSGIQFVLD